jgi:small redox-active disulfide protein 2
MLFYDIMARGPEPHTGPEEDGMKKLQILGTGCPKCRTLAEQTEKVAREMGIAYEMEKVTDIREIMKFGVMTTPALAVDGVVKVAGKVPSSDEIKKLLGT